VSDSQLAGARREKPQQIADELRERIVSGQLADGDSLGLENELVERFGVSRPSLREALRILETEGLITVVRGWRGGVVVRHPTERGIARAASAVLHARQVSNDDVFEARALLEPLAARTIAAMPHRLGPIGELLVLIGAAEEAIGDTVAYAEASAAFHERLVALAGNQTLTLLTEMLNELAAQVTDDKLRRASDVADSESSQRVGIRAHRKLLQLLEAGDVNAVEEHWRAHMSAVAEVMLKEHSSAVVTLLHQ
jgi:DNA-binding FadR family transcriptional regulator